MAMRSSAPIRCGSPTTRAERPSSGTSRRLQQRSDEMTSSLKKVHLSLPASTEDLRKLEIGSVVYLTGRIFTAREGVYKRAIEEGAGMPASKEALGCVNFHCSPAAVIEPDGRFNVGAV